MKTSALVLTVALTGWAGGTAAAGDAIYRCGNSYRQTPCADGKPVAIDASPSEAQRAEAEALADDDRRQSRRLEQERRQREASIEPARATGFNGRPTPPPATTVVVNRTTKKRRDLVVKSNRDRDGDANQRGAGVAATPAVRPK